MVEMLGGGGAALTNFQQCNAGIEQHRNNSEFVNYIVVNNAMPFEPEMADFILPIGQVVRSINES